MLTATFGKSLASLFQMGFGEHFLIYIHTGIQFSSFTQGITVILQNQQNLLYWLKSARFSLPWKQTIFYFNIKNSDDSHLHKWISHLNHEPNLPNQWTTVPPIYKCIFLFASKSQFCLFVLLDMGIFVKLITCTLIRDTGGI